ncbi:MAG: protein arginine kinase activator [Lentimonas sp.]|jgi:protein arginine kinase activator
MAKNLKCSICNKNANVHLTQIINNKIHKIDLCESCAQKKGVTDPEGFSLADLFAKQPEIATNDKVQLRCPTCGLNTAGFRRTGRFGCVDCYDVFKPLLLPMLEDMHEGTFHKGKIPAVTLSRQSSQLQLKKLQDFLTKAIAEEAYEEAAKYRDRIKELQGVENLEVSEK